MKFFETSFAAAGTNESTVLGGAPVFARPIAQQGGASHTKVAPNDGLTHAVPSKL